MGLFPPTCARSRKRSLNGIVGKRVSTAIELHQEIDLPAAWQSNSLSANAGRPELVAQVNNLGDCSAIYRNRC